MKFNPSWLLFLIGAIPLVAAYYPLKDALPPWAFVICCVAYLFGVRIISDWLASKLMAGDTARKEHQERERD
ncbi:MAG: hypothetical protein MPJ78_00815 [Hyphomicrobiaceae bacterium]|nr:hypothetical protein [Hyphomicrobiaceae bacterium]